MIRLPMISYCSPCGRSVASFFKVVEEKKDKRHGFLRDFIQGGGLEGDVIKGMILGQKLELVALETVSHSSESRAPLWSHLLSFMHVHPGGASCHPGQQSTAVSHFGSTYTNNGMSSRILA